MIFATKPTIVAKALQAGEYVALTQFPFVRLMAIGYASYLYMANDRPTVLQTTDNIAAINLMVIDIKLHFDIGAVNLSKQFCGLLRRSQKITRHVALIDGFNEQVQADLRKPVSRILYVTHVNSPVCPVCTFVADTGHDMEAFGVNSISIGQGGFNRGTKLRFTANKSCKSALA